MKKICAVSGQEFEITEGDLKFYEKMGVPTPTLCPEERMRRRLALRNERTMYYRTCDGTGKKIISRYSPDKPFPVYENDYWWSDNWDSMDYGRDFDFSRPFFEQFQELHSKVPHVALEVDYPTMENSDFCNGAGYLKNCYLVVNADNCERCLYSKGINRCFDCTDCFKVYDSEACYESLNCYNCSFSTYLWDSQNCDECHFSANLIGCDHCFGCVNLRNKSYFFLNKKYSPEEWKRKVVDMKEKHSSSELLKHFEEFRTKNFVKWMQEKNTENCTGNYLANSKDCLECYDCEYLENSKFCSDIKKGDKPSFGNYDVSFFGMVVDHCYEGLTLGYGANRVLFGENVWAADEVFYSQECLQGCRQLFGCQGLRKKQFCILNKQYKEEEYFALKEKIIEHMKKTGEWGEFFPIEISPYGYNEAVVREYFPLTKEEVLSRGWKWKDEENGTKYEGPEYKIPENIKDVTDEILEKILICEKAGKNYRIVKPELEFYRKMNLPIPRLCPDARHEARMKLRNPRKLWDRKCDKCGVGIKTSFAPDRPEKIYCEKCYLECVN